MLAGSSCKSYEALTCLICKSAPEALVMNCSKLCVSFMFVLSSVQALPSPVCLQGYVLRVMLSAAFAQLKVSLLAFKYKAPALRTANTEELKIAGTHQR